MIISMFPWGGGGSLIPDLPEFTYTGEYEKVADTDGGWRLRLLTSGTLTFTGQVTADLFAVGGGSGGWAGYYASDLGEYYGGGGGSGGYTATEEAKTLIAGHAYTVEIGAGGLAGTESSYPGAGGTTSMDNLITARGGEVRDLTQYQPKYFGNIGGSGGGSGNQYHSIPSYMTHLSGDGGSNGGDGAGTDYGTGQNSTTREFGEANGELYAGGGAGGNTGYTTQYRGGAGGGGDGAYGNSRVGGRASNGYPNTGGGGGGGAHSASGPDGTTRLAGNGGSGILIIRNAR